MNSQSQAYKKQQELKKPQKHTVKKPVNREKKPKSTAKKSEKHTVKKPDEKKTTVSSIGGGGGGSGAYISSQSTKKETAQEDDGSYYVCSDCAEDPMTQNSRRMDQRCDMFFAERRVQRRRTLGWGFGAI